MFEVNSNLTGLPLAQPEFLRPDIVKMFTKKDGAEVSLGFAREFVDHSAAIIQRDPNHSEEDTKKLSEYYRLSKTNPDKGRKIFARHIRDRYRAALLHCKELLKDDGPKNDNFELRKKMIRLEFYLKGVSQMTDIFEENKEASNPY